MAVKTTYRQGTAAAWTSANPTLAGGEKGVETDTGKFKIGDGITAWTSLAYRGQTGAVQTIPYRSMGDGSDGSVTISSGTTTLSQDAHYSSLTINGTGSLVTNGFRVFVKGILDLTAAPAGAIQWNGNSGGNATGPTIGAAATVQPGGTLGAPGTPSAATAGATGAGAVANSASLAVGNGGSGGGAGTGGGGTNAGGGTRPGAAATLGSSFRVYDINLLRGITPVNGGVGGVGGVAGGGDGTNFSGAGGGGANGGGVIAIFANIILKSANTALGAIQANGGNGGNGGNGTAGVTGGGSGGGGGGGGWVYICYNYLAGPVVADIVQLNGGSAGRCGSSFGALATPATPSTGAGGGRLTTICVPSPSKNRDVGYYYTSAFSPQASTATVPAGTQNTTAFMGNPGAVFTLDL